MLKKTMSQIGLYYSFSRQTALVLQLPEPDKPIKSLELNNWTHVWVILKLKEFNLKKIRKLILTIIIDFNVI